MVARGGFMGALLCICIGTAASGYRSEEEVAGLFEGWLQDNPRPYSSNVTEKNLRYEIFNHNLNIIDEHNALESSYKLGLNRFADLTLTEFKSHYLGKLVTNNPEPPSPFRYVNVTAPAAIDWRTKGAVTPVKDQKNCGSCWAFSTIGAVEGIVQIKTGKLLSLSEQELVSCDTVAESKGSNMGCLGGWMYTSFGWIMENGGIDYERTYPYTAQEDLCKTRKLRTYAASIDGREKVPAKNEKALQQAVANQPVSVALQAFDMKFILYASGILSGACGTNLDHAMVAVGYDTSSSGEDYWIVKNSWGKGWGEDGYMRLSRNIRSPKGMCGIALASSYPIKD